MSVQRAVLPVRTGNIGGFCYFNLKNSISSEREGLQDDSETCCDGWFEEHKTTNKKQDAGRWKT